MLSEELHELRRVSQTSKSGRVLFISILQALLTKAGSEQPPRKRRRIDADQEDLDLESLVEESTTEMVAFDSQYVDICFACSMTLV
jgi:hypothetical protein